MHLNIAPQVDSRARRRIGHRRAAERAGRQRQHRAARRRSPNATKGWRSICCAICPASRSAQNGSPGGVADLFIRGGNYNFNLVQIDGVPVNSFGGAFDFAHIPTDWLERVEVIEGPQSAVYGAYANSGVVNFVTRSAEDSPHLDVLAEGGTYQEHRFAVGAAGTLAGFGVAAFASQLGDNGPVPNSDYRNDNVALHVTRSFGRQSLSFGGDFDANVVGVARSLRLRSGARFPGLDLISREQERFLRLLPASPDRYLAALSPGDFCQFLPGQQRLQPAPTDSASTRICAGSSRRAPS